MPGQVHRSRLVEKAGVQPKSPACCDLSSTVPDSNHLDLLPLGHGVGMSPIRDGPSLSVHETPVTVSEAVFAWVASVRSGRSDAMGESGFL